MIKTSPQSTEGEKTAVYQARALLALENIELTYDDDLLCAGSQSFQIPSSEQVNFVFRFDETTPLDIHIEVIDVNGKILFKGNIDRETEFYHWNIDRVSDGIYFYQIL